MGKCKNCERLDCPTLTMPDYPVASNPGSPWLPEQWEIVRTRQRAVDDCRDHAVNWREEALRLRAEVAKWEILHGGKIDQVYSTAIDAGESFALADIRQPDPIDCGEAFVLSDDKRATQVVTYRDSNGRVRK